MLWLRQDVSGGTGSRGGDGSAVGRGPDAGAADVGLLFARLSGRAADAHLGVGSVRVHDRQGREYEYRPEVAEGPKGRIVFGNGKIGRHDGDGWVLIYGEGYVYPYVGQVK